MEARFLNSAAEPRSFPEDEGREVAVVGRSNSGKSSAINAMLGRTKLARVSKKPGRTRLINFFELATGKRLVDLPGYGYAQVPTHIREQWRDLMAAYFESRRSIVGLMITIDLRRGLTDLDEKMIVWARALEIPVHILATKADKLSRGAKKTQKTRIEQAVPNATVQLFSALDREGIVEARKRLEQWLAL
jgi:GTP-binding protein